MGPIMAPTLLFHIAIRMVTDRQKDRNSKGKIAYKQTDRVDG